MNASRIGKATRTGAPDRRNILVRFLSRDVRNDVLLSAKKVKPEGFFVNENLTPERAGILYKLRQIKKLKPGKLGACGSINGRIYVYLRSENPTGRDQKVYMKSMADLEETLDKHFGEKIEEILNIAENQNTKTT